MSSCAPCLCTLTLPTCFTTLVIGTVGALNTDYKIYIKNLTTGKTVQYSATSSGAGLVSITVSASTPFSENHSYVLWATLATGTVDEREDITISGTSTARSCFELKFETIRDSAGALATFTTVTLKKDSCCDDTTPGNECLCITQAILDDNKGGQTFSGTYAQVVAALLAGIDTTVYDKVWMTDRSVGLFLDTSSALTNDVQQLGWYLSGGVVYEIRYDLAGDEITEIHDNISNNHLIQQSGAGNTSIANFPLTNTLNFGNIFNNSDIDIIGSAALTAIENSEFRFQSYISFNDNGCNTPNICRKCELHDSSLFLLGDNGGNGSTAENIYMIASTLDLREGSVFGSLKIFSSSIGGINSSLGECEINDISISFQNENYVNKFCNNVQSTFDKTRNISSIVGVFDFDVAGYNESFAGIWNLTSNDATESITSFSNNNYIVEKTFYGQATKVFTFVHDGVNIFCNGGANAVLSSANDFITFRFVGNVAYEIARGIY